MKALYFQRIYEGHQQLVSTEVYRRVRKLPPLWNDAQDLCQNVWLTAWRFRDSFDPERGPVSAWLYAIVQSCVDRHIRDTLAKSPETVLDSSLVAQVDGEEVDGSWIEQSVPSQFTAEDDKVLDELVFRAASLSEQEAAVFNLVYWHGWSYKAVAEKMGISEGTIGPLVNRLRSKLEVLELHHRAYTYHAPGPVWGDWAWKPGGVGNQRMENNKNDVTYSNG